MKKQILLVGLIWGILLVSGCVQPELKYVCPDGKTVSDASLCPKSEKCYSDQYGSYENLQDLYENCYEEVRWLRNITSAGDYIDVELDLTKNPIASLDNCANAYRTQKGKSGDVICRLNTIYQKYTEDKILMGCWCQYVEELET